MAKLRVVTADTPAAKPGVKLGKPGAALWRDVMTEYDITDCGGLALLTSACAALDRAEACRARIDADGEVIRGKTGLREHPLLKHELQSRSFVVRTLQRLGLNVESSIKAPGRPPEPIGWTPDAER